MTLRRHNAAQHAVYPRAVLLLSLAAFGCQQPGDETPTPTGPAPTTPTTTATEKPGNVVVFAAASMRDALQDAATAWKQSQGGELTLNFGGSSTLAKQVEASRAADVFVSASEEWSDYLVKANRAQGVPTTIASNTLVVIKRKGSPWAIASAADLATLQYRLLALGDPQAVPAGKYARQYLESFPLNDGNVWARVKDKVSPAVDVRFAMGQVEADPDVLGIVYRTDALISAQVEVAYAIPPESTPPIRYVAVAIKDGPNDPMGARFVTWLLSPEGRAIIERRGFVPPPVAP